MFCISSNNNRQPFPKTYTKLHYTCRYFTSSHLNFAHLLFTTLSFGLTPFKFPTAPFYLTSPHFTSLLFTALLDNLCYCNNNNYYYYYYYYHYYHLLYAGYLHLYSWDKLCPYGIQCCSYSVVTIHGAYIVSFSVESIVFLHYYFPKYVCSAQYGCFL